MGRPKPRADLDSAVLAQVAVIAGAVSGALSAADRDYLGGPLIFHKPGGEMVCPEWLAAAIPGARLRQVLRPATGEEDLATDEELLAYLYSACLAQPLRPPEYDLYFWLAQEILPRYGRAGTIPVWRWLDQRCPLKLSPSDQARRRELRRQLRVAVIKHARLAGRENRERSMLTVEIDDECIRKA